ncbi:MAG: hypothetical protein M3P40_07430 [Actinomycetota bacterium]|nr:hypothetical protein [Actinomycetota bacterium]
MTASEASSGDESAVPLTQAEQDEINNRVLSGDAAQEDSAENVELARLGSYVVLEVDDDQHIEKHVDERSAEERYEELKADHIDRAGS